MPATSRSSGPSTRKGESWLTSCFKCVGTSKVSPGFSGSQRPVADGFCKRFHRRRSGLLRAGHVRLKVKLHGNPFGDPSEYRSGGFAAVIASPPPVRVIQHHQDTDFRFVGRKKANERRKIPARTVRELLRSARLSRHGVMFEPGLGRGPVG